MNTRFMILKNHFSIGILFVVTTGIFLCLVFYAASDVRGDDQYWYMGDVETLLTDGEKVTNTLFPVQLMEPGPFQPNGFIHNIPNLYFVLPAAALFGVFNGWIVTNVIATLLTAVIIAYLVHQACDLFTAFFAFAVYLLMPLNIWLVSQPLAEPTVTPFIATAVLLYCFAGARKIFWFLLVLVVCIAYYCRASLLPVLFLVPIAYLFHNKPVKTTKLLFAGFLFAIASFFIIFHSQIFEQNVTAGWREYINVSIPHLTDSMYLYFCLSPMSIQLNDILSKMSHNVWTQFFPTNAAFQIFYLPYNVLSGLAVFIYFKAKTPFVRNISRCAIVLTALHIMTILIFQNYARYLLVTFPALLISGIIGFDNLRMFRNIKVKKNLFYAIICLLIAVNIPLIIRSHQEGLEEKKIRSEVKMVFDKTIPAHDSVIITYEHHNLLLAYTLRPRNVIYVKPMYDTEDFVLMEEKSNAKWLICEPASPILNALGVFSPTAIKVLPAPYDRYTLFKLGKS